MQWINIFLIRNFEKHEDIKRGIMTIKLTLPLLISILSLSSANALEYNLHGLKIVNEETRPRFDKTYWEADGKGKFTSKKNVFDLQKQVVIANRREDLKLQSISIRTEKSKSFDTIIVAEAGAIRCDEPRENGKAKKYCLSVTKNQCLEIHESFKKMTVNEFGKYEKLVSAMKMTKPSAAMVELRTQLNANFSEVNKVPTLDENEINFGLVSNACTIYFAANPIDGKQTMDSVPSSTKKTTPSH